MYYLLGLNHYIQYVNKKIGLPVFTEFVQSVSTLIEEYHIELIAEEFNEDCLELNHVHRSVLQLVCEENSAIHLFVDPIQAIRNSLGIPSAQREEDLTEAYQLREEYWFNQLQLQTAENVLICIGASHIDSFSKLLLEKKRDFIVLDPYWHQNVFEKATPK